MIKFELMHFDQTHLLFILLTAIGLVRERHILPFIMVLLGSVVHGPLGAVFLASFIVWHRMDVGCSRWIQLKDVMGFLLVLVGAVATGPIQEICGFFGVLYLSLSLGRGALGIIPALLLLRQYLPHPEPLEVILCSAGVYWIFLEVIRWSKTSRGDLMKGILETFCVLGILIGFREYILKIGEEPAYLVLASVLILIPLLVFIWAKWSGHRFLILFHRVRKSFAKSIGLGNRFVSDRSPWVHESAEPISQAVEAGFNQVFVLTLITLVMLSVFLLLSRGGLS